MSEANRNDIASGVGKLYFNRLNPGCFTLRKKRVCAEQAFDFWKFSFHCVKYEHKYVAVKSKFEKF